MRNWSGKLEWASIIKNKKVLIPVIAVLFVPLLYSSLFLWAFWDPYAKMDVIPVAIVNEDLGAELNGEEIHIGSDLVEQLKQNEEFQWVFTDHQEAQEGMEENEYYMEIRIPADFSSRAASVMDEQPVKAQLQFIPNESYNFLSAQIGGTAVKELRTKLSEQLSEAYAEAIFQNVTALAQGLSQAADGAQRIYNGTEELSAGAEQIDTYLSELSAASASLRAGSGELQSGVTQLQTGTTQLQTGTEQLSSGLEQLNGKHQQIITGGEQLQQGLQQMQDSLTSAESQMSQLQTGAGQLAEGLAQWMDAHPELADDASLQSFLKYSQQIAAGIDRTAQGQSDLKNGLEQANSSTGTLVDGMKQFGSKLSEAYEGSTGVVSGVQQLATGENKLLQGVKEYAAGVDTYTTGVDQLAQGSGSLRDGSDQLVQGADELYTKLADAVEQTSAIHGSDPLYKMVANPVEIQEQKFTQVPNYGTGFAPYFISLGLFVGALLFTIVFNVKKPVSEPKSGWSWFLGKWSVLAPIGIIQALLVDVIVLGILKLEVQSVWQFIGLSMLTSLTFMALIQFLVTIFADAGRFLAIIILILQLTTSAGTFPLELIPNFLQHFNKLLPMTYSVFGFKAAISSGNTGQFWDNVMVLLVFAVVLAALTFVYLTVVKKKSGTVTEQTV
ncbi:YhgE/Pip family protein [Marinicrinis lubricantis]|uniref:YhgE/Pip family protein n=1 Tax=Marinicrinis lubricantis TaxID=2086470 RepID=A0ABW1IK59_9BACL